MPVSVFRRFLALSSFVSSSCHSPSKDDNLQANISTLTDLNTHDEAQNLPNRHSWRWILVLEIRRFEGLGSSDSFFRVVCQ